MGSERTGRKFSRRGQTLVAAIMLMAVALIMVPMLVMLVQRESKWTVKQARSGIAYHLAEAGQDRAVWYIAQSTTNWQTALSGAAMTGYSGDVQYSDVAGGLYTIRISSGPGATQITVISKGRDSSTEEIRTIKGIYDTGILLSGFIAGGSIDYQPNFTVHWGQVTSFTSIDLANSGVPRFPIRDSRGAVDPWDTSASPPNEDSARNYISYDAKLTTPPQVDFDYYRQKAKETRAPDPGGVGGGSNGGQSALWRGTGYFDGTSEVKFKSYTFNCSTCVFFLESSKAKIDDSASNRGFMRVAALVVYTSNIHIHGRGANPYAVSVPTDAWKQYTAGTPTAGSTPDGAAQDEYPGDGGLNSVKATHTLPNAIFDGAAEGIPFHGFLYSNSFDCSGGNNVLVGQFIVGSGGTSINTMIIYFDPNIASEVHYLNNQVKRVSWDEILSNWP